MGGSPIANSVKVFSLEISLYMELSFCIVAIKIGGGEGGWVVMIIIVLR